MSSKLTPTQRYAAGALFGLALNQAQIHQTLLLGSCCYDELTEDRESNASSSSDSVAEDPLLWVNESSGLLRPVFRFFEIKDSYRSGSSSPSRHIGAFLRLLAEESVDDSLEASDYELALSNAVNAMVASIETTPEDYESKKEKQRAYADELQEKLATNESKSELEKENLKTELEQEFGKEHSKNEQEKDCEIESTKPGQEKDCKIKM